MTKRNYSRLARVEEKKDIRSAFIFAGLTIAIIAFFLFFGLFGIAKFAGFLSELGSSGKPVEKNDFIPPAPPEIEELPEFTNNGNLTLKGTAESASTIKISINSQEKETVVDASGIFNLTLLLKNGSNEIYAKAIDQSGNSSGESRRFNVVLDTESPKMLIKSPSDSQIISGISRIEIQGNSDEDAVVTLNGRALPVKAGGEFKDSYTLSEGPNEFEFKATDKAGNETIQVITVSFAL